MIPNPPPFDSLSGQFGTILIDPPWRFINRTGKMAPEHKRLHRYPTMSFKEIEALPVERLALPKSHLYLWCPNALIAEGLQIMRAWGFTYKTNIVWFKVRKDGGPDGRGVGFYFRNVTELLLFGVRGNLRTREAGRSQVNMIRTRKQEHSRKPDEAFDIIEACSPGPYLELFARFKRAGWTQWGDQVESYEQTRPLYSGYNGHAMNGNGSHTASGNGVHQPSKRGRKRRRGNDPVSASLFPCYDDT
jgi:N6-adenosine-specific RNA methylase IME4